MLSSGKSTRPASKSGAQIWGNPDFSFGGIGLDLLISDFTGQHLLSQILFGTRELKNMNVCDMQERLTDFHLLLCVTENDMT